MKSKLFEPINIGTIRVRNRLVMAPMVTRYGDSSGFVTQRLIEYYAERAKNNVGLIIVEAACVAPGGRVAANQLGIDDDAFIPGLRNLAEAINKSGARCFLQLQHTGRRAHSILNDGIQPVAPSAIPMRNGEVPRELTIGEIEGIIEAFAQGARRAKDAGFDGVELHFAHGYLIAQFLSALTNKRTDKYGGDLASRARVAVQIVERVRQRVGESYPLSARICGDEYIKGGLTIKDAQKITAMLEGAGINTVDVSAGYTASHEEGYLNALIPWSSAPMPIPHGYYLHLAEGIKRIAKVPIIAVGRLDDPNLAEEVIAQGKADLVAIGRGFLADAAFATKVYNQQHSEVRRCIACVNCITRLFTEGLTCTVNPEAGRETEYQISPASRAKRVVVVGGGPGGMEVARVAALRGHKVILTEKKPYLGGNMVPAAAVTFKRDVGMFTEFLSNAVRKAGVEVRMNTEINESTVNALKPDVVILATGALPLMPNIPGIERKNVIDAVSVLEGRSDTGAKVVVVGGGMVGCEVAVFLAQSGKEVTLVTRRETDFSDTGGLAPDMEPVLRRWFLFELLPDLPMEIIGKSTYKEAAAEGLIVEDREGKRRLVASDTVVFALGLQPNNSLRGKLEGKVPELYEVGDCIKPRKIIDAVAEAAKVARLI